MNLRGLAGAFLLGALLPLPAAYNDGGALLLERIIATNPSNGLTRPVFLTHAPGDNDRLFILEKRTDAGAGRIRIYKKSTGALLSTPFLSIGGLNTGNEEGLLGLAFHPDYQDNGYFYVYFSDNDEGDRVSLVRRYTSSIITGSAGPSGPPTADRADPLSAKAILRVLQPASYASHKAGWMGFQPVAVDSSTETNNPRYFLYMALGDGGSGNDPFGSIGNGQDKNVLLGKVLRIDVGRNGDADDFPADMAKNYSIPASNPFAGTDFEGAPIVGEDEIFLYGLRNPWRCAFDRQTGDLYIADVGQNAREEINVVPASLQDVKTGNRNLGWRLREGSIQTPSVGGSAPPDHHPPLLDYRRSNTSGTPVINGVVKGNSVTGGHIYRGTAMPWLRGTYFFADWFERRIWSFRDDSGTSAIEEYADRTDELSLVANGATKIGSFGEDSDGEIYLLTNSQNSASTGSGEVFLLTQDAYSLWKNAHFTVEQILDENASGPEADLDGDGKSTLEEFALGCDPTAVDLPLGSSTTVQANGGAEEYLTLSLVRNPESFGVVTITGESGPSPAALSNANTTTLDDTPELFRFRDNVSTDGANQRFGRFHFELSAP